MGSTWSLLGPTWSLLGASWAQLGASRAPLGVDLGLLDASWAQLGASWPPSWALYSRLGSSPWPLGLQVGLRTADCVDLPGLLAAKLGSARTFVQLSPASWATFVRVFAICAPVSTALPGLLSATLCHVHPSVLFAMMYYLTCELPFELTQQLPVRTKLHLNFHNSCRF